MQEQGSMTMQTDCLFEITRVRFDEDYLPSDKTRLTTNFANLARGERRQENLRNTLTMVNNRFNSLAYWDNPKGDRYSVELDILSVEMHLGSQVEADAFPLIEILQPIIFDKKTRKRIQGIAGNSFSSYVRDYDFSVLLPQHNKGGETLTLPDQFGDLHGKLFQRFLKSDAYQKNFAKQPVICISASSSKTYRRLDNQHPILGVEYQQSEASLTDLYFEKMGMRVRYFMPPHSVAPFAFYFIDELPDAYTNLELIGTISTMETFQKIYRPEIYNANCPAGKVYQPRLDNQDYSLAKVFYDREERSQLAVKQGKYAESYFIKPYKNQLEQWARGSAL